MLLLTCVQIPAWAVLLVAVGIDSEVEAGTPMFTLCLLLGGFSQGLHHFLLLPAVTISSCFFRTLPALMPCGFSSHPDGCKVVSSCGFDLDLSTMMKEMFCENVQVVDS